MDNHIRPKFICLNCKEILLQDKQCSHCGMKMIQSTHPSNPVSDIEKANCWWHELPTRSKVAFRIGHDSNMTFVSKNYRDIEDSEILQLWKIVFSDSDIIESLKK